MMISKKNRKVKIMILLVCIVIITGIVVYKTPYKCDYMKKIGTPLGTNYEKIIEKFGNPDKIEKEKDMWEGILDYSDKRFYFYRREANAPVERVDILSDSIEFGWRKVKVGMPRNMIEKIYINNEKILDTDEDTFGIIDSPWWIYFEFDENDVLKEIDFCFGP